MRILLIIIGTLLVLFGLLTIFLPLPTGVLSLMIGSAILVTVSRTFRRFFKWLRKRFRPLNTAVAKAEAILPDRIRKPLEETDPDEDTDEVPASGKKAADRALHALAVPDQTKYRRPISRAPRR